jgi:hypothetical protein
MKKLLIAIPFLFLAAACNKQQAQVQPVQNPPVQTSPSAQVQQPQATSTDETANWKIYTNDKYGFEFKYPMNFSSGQASKELFGQATEVASVTGKDGGYVSARIMSGTLDPKHIQELYGEVPSTKVKTVSIGSKIGYEYTTGDAGCGGSEVQTQLNSNNILLVYFASCEGEKYILVNDDKTIAQILSSFKFTK